MEIKHLDGHTLHEICIHGHLEIVKLLLTKFLDLKINEPNNSAFHLACDNGHSNIVDFFIKNYPDVDYANIDIVEMYKTCTAGVHIVIPSVSIHNEIDMPRNLSDYAPCEMHKKVAQVLIDNLPERCVTTNDKSMLYKMYINNLSKNDDNYIKTIEILLSNCKNINIEIDIFYLLCENNKLCAIKKIIKHIDFNNINEIELQSCFEKCCQNGYLDIVKYLIKKFPTLHQCSLYTFIKLFENGYLELIKFLVNCYPKLLDYSAGKIVFLIVCNSGNIEVLNYLLKYLPKFETNIDNGFIIACKNYDYELMRYLSKYLDNFNIEKNNYETLKIISKKCTIDILDHFINFFDIKMPIVNEIILPIICLDGNLEIVIYIINKFPYIDIYINNCIILHNICKSGNLEILKLLVDHYQCNINLYGQQLFKIACENCNIDIMNFLLEYVHEI